MSPSSEAVADLKSQILRDPDAVLDDRDIMKALISAGGGSLGRNVVDLRGALVDRLEDRLDRLEHTHRSVIAAAYENLAGTNQVHRAVLNLLEPVEFDGFLRVVGWDLPGLLSIDVVRIGLETDALPPGSAVGPTGDLHDLVVSLAPGGVDAYFGEHPEAPQRRTILLRQSLADGALVYGDDARWIRSEALMRLDLGRGRRPGVLLFGAEDPHRFSPDQGTDLLRFFGGVFERVLGRWLA
ncbi:MAG: DUF484 family protein [Alphaproteobacteria bacterium]|nr:MAG: DUF484 family protein [Alphaproteobacteria bacterium]